MIVILLGAIKRAELAIDVANVGVIDVAIDDISDDLAPAAVVAFFLREIAPRIGQRPQLSERPAIKLKRLRAGNALAGENFLLQRFFLERDHPNAI